MEIVQPPEPEDPVTRLVGVEGSEYVHAKTSSDKVELVSFRPIARGVLSLVTEEWLRSEGVRCDKQRETEHAKKMRLGPDLPDLRVSDIGRFADGNLVASIWLSLASRKGSRLLPTTAGYLAAHLAGRMPFIFMDDTGDVEVFIIQFCVDDYSVETQGIIAEFAGAARHFLGLPETARVAAGIRTDEQVATRVPESVRLQLSRTSS